MLRWIVRSLALVFTFAVLAGLIGALAYFQFSVKPDMIKGFIAHAPRPVPSVMAARAESQSWTPKLPAVGTFTAFKGINVAPQLGGVVAGLNFDSGQDVKAGDKLLQIDDSTEEADFKNGQAQLKNAEVGLDRQRKLMSSNNTAQANFDTALASRDSAAATVERDKALIAQKLIRAPFDGRLGIRRVDIGQYVSPGTALVTLQQLDPIYVDFSLPQQNIAVLRIGQGVDVEVDAYPAKPFHGKIQSIDARVNQDTRNILVRAVVENVDKKLLPGMFGNVEVIAGEPKTVVTVPRTAVTYSLYGDSVFVLTQPPQKPGAGDAPPANPADKPLIAEKRFVRVGETQADAVAISEGVAAGDMVVAAGQIKLQPNAAVKIDTNATLTPPAVRPKA